MDRGLLHFTHMYISQVKSYIYINVYITDIVLKYLIYLQSANLFRFVAGKHHGLLIRMMTVFACLSYMFFHLSVWASFTNLTRGCFGELYPRVLLLDKPTLKLRQRWIIPFHWFVHVIDFSSHESFLYHQITHRSYIYMDYYSQL